MSDDYFALPVKEQLRILGVIQEDTGRSAAYLEKDIWIVLILAILFDAEIGENLVFKGATSLTKGYLEMILRFSEDVDLARAMFDLASDLLGDADSAGRLDVEQKRKRQKEIRRRLGIWIVESVAPFLTDELAKTKTKAKVRVSERKIFVKYPTVTPESEFVNKEVKLEFSPCETRTWSRQMPIECDVSSYEKDIMFPKATPQILDARCTFWEKVTAMHLLCLQGGVRKRGFSRHLYDIAEMYSSGIARQATAERSIVEAVARHKKTFYFERDSGGRWVDHLEAFDARELRVVPSGDALDALEFDYRELIESGMIYGPIKSFQENIDICHEIEKLVNEGSKS